MARDKTKVRPPWARLIRYGSRHARTELKQQTRRRMRQRTRRLLRLCCWDLFPCVREVGDPWSFD